MDREPNYLNPVGATVVPPAPRLERSHLDEGLWSNWTTGTIARLRKFTRCTMIVALFTQIRDAIVKSAPDEPNT